MPGSLLLLNESEIRECVGLDLPALSAVEEGFSNLFLGKAVVPPPIGIEVQDPQAEIHVKSAYVIGLSGFAVKIASGFYQNAQKGLPVSSGLMVLFSAETGWPQALLLDNAYLTEVRTALAGAIAAKYLAKSEIETVGVVGVGAQARFQVEALRLVRRFKRVVVYGRRPEPTREYVKDVSKKLDVEVIPARDTSEVVRRSDIVITATSAREPLVGVHDVHEGLHITAVGSDGPGKQELDPRVLARADVLACDLKSQCFRLGELQHGLAAGSIREDSPIVELGQLTSGHHDGRHSPTDITVCDLTGVGVQDSAIAVFAYERAKSRGLGRTF
jgi:ectoine utilization protein EutC